MRNLHLARRPDKPLTAPGSARGVQRRAELPSCRQGRAEVPAGRPEKPALSISVQTKRPSFRMHTPRRVIHDTFSLRAVRRRRRSRSSTRSTRCSRCTQLERPAHPRLRNMDERMWDPRVCVTNRLVCATRRIRMCVVDGIAVARRTTVVSVHGLCVVGGGTRCPRPVVCDASTSRLTCWLSHGEELSQSMCQQYLLTTYQQRGQRGEARRK